jgi:hypothetical protein
MASRDFTAAADAREAAFFSASGMRRQWRGPHAHSRIPEADPTPTAAISTKCRSWDWEVPDRPPKDRWMTFDLEALLGALEGFELILVGGVAAAVQGVPVITQDVDILYQLEPR